MACQGAELFCYGWQFRVPGLTGLTELTDHATSRLRWSDHDTKGEGAGGLSGSVGCHDVTNTCSTKPVMQLLRSVQAVGTGGLLSRVPRLAGSDSSPTDCRRLGRCRLSHPAPSHLAHNVNPPAHPPLGALVRLRLCPPSISALPPHASMPSWPKPGHSCPVSRKSLIAAEPFPFAS